MRLTIKQKAFLKTYIETKNATEAAMQVYNCKDRLSARNIGSENLAKLGIKDELQYWFEQEGMTNAQLVGDVKKLKDFEDWRALAEGIKIEMKLKNLDQTKVDLTSGGKPISILGGDSVQKNNSDTKDITTGEKN